MGNVVDRKTIVSAIPLVIVFAAAAIWGITWIAGDRSESDSGQSVVQEADKALLSEQKFLSLLAGNDQQVANTLAEASATWDVSYVPMLLEVSRFLPDFPRARVMGPTRSKNGSEL